jgi:hypothetical protein
VNALPHSSRPLSWGRHGGPGLCGLCAARAVPVPARAVRAGRGLSRGGACGLCAAVQGSGAGGLVGCTAWPCGGSYLSGPEASRRVHALIQRVSCSWPGRPLCRGGLALHCSQSRRSAWVA